MFGRPILALLLCGIPLPALSQDTLTVGANVWVSRERAELVQVEPILAADPADPNRLVVAAIGLRHPFAPDWQDHQTIVVYQSENGGRSWSHRAVAALPDSWSAGDPWLAWLEDGGLILSAIAGEAITRQGDPPARARLFHSDDGGRTWDSGGRTPFAVNSAEDHPVLAIGYGGSEHVLYAVATHATSREEGVDVARIGVPSLEATPVTPLRPTLEQVNLGGAVVRPGNELVVSFFSMRPPRSLWSSRRDPITGSWSETRIRESILPVGFPSLAVDPSSVPFAGRVYSVWVESEDQVARVLLAWSDDGGATWSAPTQVHADGSRVLRTLPVVAVAPDGAVGVVWQDRRNAEGRECSDLYGAVSTDGGASFIPEVRVSSETVCPGDYEQNGAAAARFRLGGGDYQGLAATGPGAFQAVWSDSRTGRYQLWTAWLQVQQETDGQTTVP